LVKDEMRLRKRLREVEALESAAAGGQRLDAAQTAKLSKRAAILADLATVREQINEARQQLEKPQASRQTADEQPAGSSGNNSKRKNAQKARGPQKAAPPVDPLPQRGRAAMPINPLLAAAASEGGSASRIAAIAPSSTVVTRPTVQCVAVDDHRVHETSRGVSMSDFMSSGTEPAPGSRGQPPPPSRHKKPSGSTAPVSSSRGNAWRPPPPPVPATAGAPQAAAHSDSDEGLGFVQVKRGAKPKGAGAAPHRKAAVPGKGDTGGSRQRPGAPQAPIEDDDDDVFW